MSWRANLLPASFRGVAFFVENESEEFGAQYQVHQYPLRTRPYTEYLGGAAQQWRMSLFVLGDDYMRQRDALRIALATPGPGTLVHPKLGRLEVVAIEPRRSENTREGGMARFDVTFCIYGGMPSPDDTVDTLAGTYTASDKVDAAVAATYADTAVPTGVDDLDTESAGLVAGLADTLSNINGRIQSGTSAIARTAADITRLGEQASTLLQQPAKLAALVGSVIGATMGAAKSLQSALDIYDNLQSQIPLTAFRGDMTRGRRQQTVNNNALATLNSTLALTSAVRYVVNAARAVDVVTNDRSPFASLDDAQAVQAKLGGAMSDQMAMADDATRALLADLRAALYKHLRAHSKNLARVTGYQVGQSVPVLVLAYDLYGDASRESDLIRRNRIKHPLFTPANRSLEVLSA